jgi:hypothetical protein
MGQTGACSAPLKFLETVARKVTQGQSHQARRPEFFPRLRKTTDATTLLCCNYFSGFVTPQATNEHFRRYDGREGTFDATP